MGGDSIFFPMCVETEKENVAPSDTKADEKPNRKSDDETSILDHIRELILNAQEYGCWKVGVGGITQPISVPNEPSVLDGLPLSSVLDCGINLWRNLEIDDDELLEIAIRDVSYQIQLHQAQDEINDADRGTSKEDHLTPLRATSEDLPNRARRRFNPRIDPTVLYLEIKNTVSSHFYLSSS